MKMKRIVSLLVMIFILCTGMDFAEDESQLVSAAWKITSAVLWVGYAVALGMVVYIGIKYITGAADAKANMKSAVISYLIGALIVFSATTIAQIVVGLAVNNSSGSGGLANTIVENANNAAKQD